MWKEDQLDALAQPLPAGQGAPLRASDIDFLESCEALRKRQVRMTQRWIPTIGLAFVVVFFIWAGHANVEQVTRGQGKVIPSKKVQLIQSLESGLVEHISVTEGQLVEKGEELLRMRDAIFSANYQENAVRRDTLLGRMARLRAEAEGFREPEFPAGLSEETVALESALFAGRRDDYLSMKNSLEKRLALAREEDDILSDGRRSGAVSRVELIRLQREVADLEGQLSTLTTHTAREALEACDKDRAEFVVLDQTLKREKDRLDRTVFRSPVRGTVNKIHINTVGRVIGSGEDIMEIVPADDSLLIEANVRPADIGFLRPNHPANVKFTAYDFTVYGGLEGVVEHIGSDTVLDPEGESYYPIKVRTSTNSLGKNRDGELLDIIPGMVAEVDVLTGKKTVLQYLLTPVNRAKQRALRER